MKKIRILLFSILILTISLVTKAQTDYRSPDYKFWQQMSVGKGDGTATNPNAWLEIGKYGTSKGMILPRVNHNLMNVAEGNFIYDINTQSLWFSNASEYLELFTTQDALDYDSAYINAKFFPLTSTLKLYRKDQDSTTLNIGQTLTLSGNALSISGGNSVNFTTSNVSEGSNLYFTSARARQTIALLNGLSYNATTGIGELGGTLNKNTNIDLATFNITINNGANNVLKTESNGNVTLGGYGARSDAGFVNKVLFVDNTGLIKSGLTNFLTTETDPIFSASPAFSITNTNITNWNAAYNDKINSIGFIAGTGILTLTQQDGGTLTTNLTHTHTATFTGDATGTGTITGSIALTIPNSTITYAKIQNITASRLLGRYAATAGVAQEISIGTGLTLNSTTGVLSNSGIITETDPIWTAAIPNYYTKTNLQTTGQAAVHYGNLTNIPNTVLSGDVAGTGTTAISTTIQPAAVTYAKIQNVAASRLLGRYTGTAGTTQEISIGTGLTLNSTTGVLSSSGVLTETDPVFSASPAFGITGTNITNWNTAYNDKINSLAFSGTTTKTLTLTQQDGGTVTGTFTDLGITTETDPIAIAKTITLTAGTGISITGAAQTINSNPTFTINNTGVTSVGLALPSIFTVSGSPVTTTGTLTGVLATQNANIVFAGPTTGVAAAPTFRSLVAADIPNLDAAKITTGTIATARLGSGSASSTTALFGDQTYKTVVTTESDPTAIKNQTTAQTANFNISGSGTIGNGLTANGLTTITGDVTLASTPSGGIAFNFDGGNTTGDLFYRTATGYLLPLHPGTNGQILSLVSGLPAWITPASPGTGTVTSVGLALPSIFTVSGSPVTASGTLTGTLAVQTTNLVFASPNGSTGTPTFRSLVAADIPNLDAAKITTGTIATARLGSGTANSTTALFGDQTYKTVLTSFTETDPVYSADPASGITSTNITNWNAAYNDKINSLAFSGTTTKTLTLTQQDGGTVTGTFTDLGITTETDPIVSARTITLTAGTGMSITGGTQSLAANRTWTITNSDPDQTVVLNNGTGISVTGTYPNFTVTNSSPFTTTSGAYIQNQTAGTQSADFGINGFGIAFNFRTTAGTSGAGSPHTVLFNTSSNWRWATGLTATESGSNVGSDYYIARYDDGSTLIDKPLIITRSTGNATFSGSVTAAGGGFNSLRSLKKDITDFTGDALKLIDSLKIYNFKYKNNNKDNFIGMIIDEKNEVPQEMLMNNGTAINTYNTISILIKAIQELNQKIDNLTKEK